MELWLNRAGSHGEFEQKFLDEEKIYLTWDGLNKNLKNIDTRNKLVDLLEEVYPDEKSKRLINHSSQIWQFVKVMKKGDWVVLPSKKQPVIYVGRITSNYLYNSNASNPYFHCREVEWFGQEIPRSHFGQDLLYSFGAFMTVCRIRRNNALSRLQTMYKNGWQKESLQTLTKAETNNCTTNNNDDIDTDYEFNLSELAKQQVVNLIEMRFKGHELTRLVASILQAKGYTIWQSPEGSDGGVDILASDGKMGFGHQTICVEVKSGTGTTDRPTIDKLLGAMSKFNANQGLFVAWGGFKQNVEKDLASSFFRLRLWSQDDLLNELFAVYDELEDEIKAQLPLKRIWTVAIPDD